MSAEPGYSHPRRLADLVAVAARWLLAVVFIYTGVTKLLQPEEFLKIVRLYGMSEQPLLLNSVAALLPWFEVICGGLLLAGVAVRGTAMLLVAMLVPFTTVILLRALDIHETGGLPFCAIQFDCGCGPGVVPICRKLAENAALTFLSGWLVFSRRECLCLWHTVIVWPAPRSGLAAE